MIRRRDSAHFVDVLVGLQYDMQSIRDFVSGRSKRGVES